MIWGGYSSITVFVGNVCVAVRANVGLRRDVLIAFYTTFPGGFMMGFFRPVGCGFLKVYAAAYAAWRGLGRSDVI
jgi:hypothetical protein